MLSMAPSFTIKILDELHVSPQPHPYPTGLNSSSLILLPSPITSSSLPLTFFDIPWLLFSPSKPLFFYSYPYPTSHFTSTILHTLIRSLSFTLHHFRPFTGTLVQCHPSSHDDGIEPGIVYGAAEQDSISVIVAECTNSDDSLFNELCSYNAQRNAHVFHQFVPHDELTLSGQRLLAVRITVFPNAGFSIGFEYHNVVGDQRTFNNFIKTWSLFSRLLLMGASANGESSSHQGNGMLLGGEDTFTCNGLISPPPPSPVIHDDRSIILDSNNVLKSILLQQYWSNSRTSTKDNKSPSNKHNNVRATFVMDPRQIEKARHWILAQCIKNNKPPPVLLSSYVVACAFIWTCLIRTTTEVTAPITHDNSDQSSSVYFHFIAGGITRLKNYVVPTSYVGNCVAFGRAEATRSEVASEEDGMVAAAAAIADRIKALDNDVLGGVKSWISDWVSDEDFCRVNVIGSPKVDLYETDFGLGRPRKIEEIGIDESSCVTVSLMESRDVRGGMEVGLVLPKVQMDGFALLFRKGLRDFHAC